MNSVRQSYNAIVGKLAALLVTACATLLLMPMPLICAESAGPSSPGGKSESPVKISAIEITGLRSIDKSELLYLLDLKEGEPLDPYRLRVGIKRAFLKGIFDDISVETVASREDALKISITERPVVSSVDIQGNQYVSSGLLRKAVSVKKGQRYNPAANEKNARDLNDILRKKGFPESTVSCVTDKNGSERVGVTFLINEGSPLIVRNLKILGDDETISKHVGIKIGDVFDGYLLEEAGEKIRADLKSRDIIGSRFTYKYDNGTLIIRLSKGSRLEVDFEGNSHFSSDTLKKEAPFFELDTFSDDILEETVRRIVTLYHKDGYADIQIAPVVSSPEDGRSLKFYINEGTRYGIEKIDFEGVKLPVDKLKELLRLQAGEDYNPDLIGPDVDTVREFYRSLGYIYTEAKEPVVNINKDNVSIIFGFTEGIQVKMARIDISDNKAISTDKMLKEIPLKKDNPYNEIDILNSRRKILDLYHKMGFLEAAVTINKNITEGNASVTFGVKEGPKSYFGKTVVIGNEDTRRVVITRNLKHKEEEPFNNSLLLTERQKLYRTGIFSGVDIQPSDRIGQSRDVLYRVEEGDAGAVEFGVGYAEYEKFRGFFDISYKNLFGMNREIAFRTELSTLTRRFILYYTEPWFLNEDLTFKAQLMKEYRKEINIDNQDVRYRVDRYLALAGVEKKFTDRLKGDIYYEISHVNTYDVKPDIVLIKEDTGTIVIGALKSGLIYDARDNPFEPRHGLLAGATFKLASSAFLSETNFAKAQLYVNGYQELFRGLVFAASLRGGYAVSFDGKAPLPLVERFFLGGRTTVRGYDQDMLGPKGNRDDPTGGNIFLMGNAEFRIHIWKGFGIVAFLDAGNVWQDSTDFRPADIKFTTGLGLRYNTPVGPIRVDYGLKLSRQHGEGMGAVHFSVGHAF
jgi:outer membrane protein insertion porin family